MTQKPKAATVKTTAIVTAAIITITIAVLGCAANAGNPELKPPTFSSLATKTAQSSQATKTVRDLEQALHDKIRDVDVTGTAAYRNFRKTLPHFGSRNDAVVAQQMQRLVDHQCASYIATKLPQEAPILTGHTPYSVPQNAETLRRECIRGTTPADRLTARMRLSNSDVCQRALTIGAAAAAVIKIFSPRIPWSPARTLQQVGCIYTADSHTPTTGPARR